MKNLSLKIYIFLKNILSLKLKKLNLKINKRCYSNKIKI